MKWKLAEWRGGKEGGKYMNYCYTHSHTHMYVATCLRGVKFNFRLLKFMEYSWLKTSTTHHSHLLLTCSPALSLSLSLPPTHTHSREHKSNILYAYLYCPCCSLLLLHFVQCGWWREIKVLLFSEKFLHFNATLLS